MKKKTMCLLNILHWLEVNDMKRYVKEFANDELKCCSEKRKMEIERILNVHERGLITSFETVALIVETYYNEDQIE